MKKLFFTLSLVLLTIISFSQAPTFTLSEEKPTFPNQFVAIEVDGLTIPDGYTRALEWINMTYDTPSEVIKSQLENKYIRIQGIVRNLHSIAALIAPSNVRYTIEFKFKDNKVKFDVIELEWYAEPSQYGPGGWSNLEFVHSKMYKKNGKPKKSYSKKAHKVMNYFNELVLSMETYLKKPIEGNDSGDDDW